MMNTGGERDPRGGWNLAGDVARGAIAGAVAWWAMDHALRRMRDHEGDDARRREDRARGGVPALEVAAARVADAAGRPLSVDGRQAGGRVAQWLVGIGGGMVFGVLAPRVPAVRAGRGLAFGAAFSLVVDEGITPLLGLAPGPAAFPRQTHARGFIGHLLYGAAADATLRATRFIQS